MMRGVMIGKEGKEELNGELSLMIRSELDIVSAREKGKWMAEEIGFRGTEVTLLSTIISELARKVVSMACGGNMRIQSVQKGTRKGITISVTQNTVDIYRVTDYAVSSQARNLLSNDDKLLLLAGRHVADEFEIRPVTPKGTIVKVVKWL